MNTLNKPYTRQQYAEFASWCNMNNAHIEDKGEYLEAVRNPEHTPTKEEQIQALRGQIAETDHKTLEFIDGYITEAQYKTIKEARNALRQQIADLENQQ